MRKKLIPVAAGLLVVLTIFLTACRVGSSPLPQAVTVPVTATKNFGREIVFQREAVIDRRMTAQEVLAAVTDIQMDGSYIVEFEGLRGNDRVYWLYYINGMFSKVFASGYLIRPGDVMYWDFHTWTGTYHGSSAIIGNYPEPFIHGYDGSARPTLVVYGNGFHEEASRLLSLLRKLGVAYAGLREETALTGGEKSNSNLIIIAGPQSQLVSELNDESKALGMYARFNGEKLVVSDYLFAAIREYGAGTGMIQACQNLWNPLGTGSCQNVVFLVSGTDETGARSAAQAFISSSQDILEERASAIDNAYGVIVTAEGEIIKTPL